MKRAMYGLTIVIVVLLGIVAAGLGHWWLQAQRWGGPNDRRLYLLDPHSVRGSEDRRLYLLSSPPPRGLLLMHAVSKFVIDEPQMVHLGDYAGYGDVWLWCPSGDVKTCRDQGR
jgi:hypothetical protein